MPVSYSWLGGVIFLYIFFAMVSCTEASTHKPELLPERPCRLGKGVPQLVSRNILNLDSAANGTISNTMKRLSYDYLTGTLTCKNGQGNSLAPQYYTLVVPANAMAQVILPDSTCAWLNAGSSLYFPDCFLFNRRYVELSGEGYFSVSRMPDSSGYELPFTIQLHDRPGSSISIILRSAKCNVRGWCEDGYTEITMFSGMAEMDLFPRHVRKNMTAFTGDRLRLDMHDKWMRKKMSGLVDQEVQWVKGNFYFRDQLVGPVMKQLSRWYGKNIVCIDTDKSIRSTVFNRSIPVCDELIGVVSQISLTDSTSCRWSRDTVFVHL